MCSLFGVESLILARYWIISALFAFIGTIVSILLMCFGMVFQISPK